MLSVEFWFSYAKCGNAECCYAECRGTFEIFLKYAPGDLIINPTR
jgi:hypothetical protein